MNKPEPTVEEIRKIALAEMRYWEAAPTELGIAAVGACANILAATYGLRAPWHPGFDAGLVTSVRAVEGQGA